MLVTLPPDLAERFGATEADVRQDDDEYAFWHVIIGGVEVRSLTERDLTRLIAMAAPDERAPEPGPGRPLKRGERRPRGWPKPATAPVTGGRGWGTLSAHRTR